VGSKTLLSGKCFPEKLGIWARALELGGPESAIIDPNAIMHAHARFFSCQELEKNLLLINFCLINL
jgi:hypothetical protein